MSFNVGNFEIISGINQEDNGSLKGFLDHQFSVKLNYDDANIVKWWFVFDGSTLQITEKESPDPLHYIPVIQNAIWEENPLIITLTDWIDVSNIGEITIKAQSGQESSMGIDWSGDVEELPVTFNYPIDYTDQDNNEFYEESNVVTVPFFAKILSIDNNKVTINTNWDEFQAFHNLPSILNPTEQFVSWSISYQHQDKRDLFTYLHFGEDKMLLTTNVKEDRNLFDEYPYSAVFRLYEPLSDVIE